MMSADIDAKLKRTILLRTIAGLSVGLVVMLTLGGLAVSSYYATQTRQVLIDCTTPTGDCSKKNQEMTAKAVSELIEANRLSQLETQQVIIQAAVCADEPAIRSEADKIKRISLMEDCINDGLKRSK